MSLRIRNAMITIQDVNRPIILEKNVNYIIWQKEKGEKTGKEHIQMYAEFTKALTIGQIKKIFGECHIEMRKGSQEQAIKYCSKTDTRIDGFWELGVKKEQGKRNDLIEVAEKIKKGDKMSKIADEYPVTYIKYNRGMEKLKFIVDSKNKKFRKIETIVLWGAPGTGKTKFATENSEDYFKLDNYKSDHLWFDGYDGEKTLILDDFYGNIKFDYFLKILDGYDLRLEIKGGFTWAKWEKIYITSNKHPDEWYNIIKYDENLKGAYKRRINKIIEYKNDQVVPENMNPITEAMYKCTEVAGNTIPPRVDEYLDEIPYDDSGYSDR